MSNPLHLIDRIPLAPLTVAAILLALAPFQPEPHLVEKVRMLGQGQLSRPIDIFDLFLHSTPLALLLIRLARMAVVRGRSTPGETP